MAEEQKKQSEEGFDPNNVVIYSVKDKAGNARKAMDLESLKIWLTHKISQANPFYVNTESIEKISDFENLIYNEMFVELNELLDTELGINEKNQENEVKAKEKLEETEPAQPQPAPEETKQPEFVEGEVEEAETKKAETDKEPKYSDEDDDVVTLE